MAQLQRITKNNKMLIDDLEFIGIGTNLTDISTYSTPQIRVEFKRENGTKISFKLYKNEVKFLIKEIDKYKTKTKK